MDVESIREFVSSLSDEEWKIAKQMRVSAPRLTAAEKKVYDLLMGEVQKSGKKAFQISIKNGKAKEPLAVGYVGMAKKKVIGKKESGDLVIVPLNHVLAVGGKEI